MQCAAVFALRDVKSHQIPVVLEIEFKGLGGIFEMGEGFSAYPEEEEVLLQDGLQYSIGAITEEFTDDTKERFFFVELKYPA